jgi:hypothetical protein
MTLERVTPDKCFTVEKLVTTSEAEIFTTPSDVFERKIYRLVIANRQTSPVTISLVQYKGTEVEKNWVFVVPAGDTKVIGESTENPVLGIPSGRTLKGVASADVNLLLDVYDL